jgi:[lysine-biosynthesis-protein LysW]---L-2-aminoadipate ligase
MLALVAHRRHGTNGLLAEQGAVVMSPRQALQVLGADDVAVGRLDVRRDLGGVQAGLWSLRRLERAGVHVLNSADALTAMHDKLVTSVRLGEAGLPHPRTGFLAPSVPATEIALPAVVKPRFGSWGRHVYLCETRRQLRRCLRTLREEAWFRNQGAIVQELVPPPGRDLRVLVAGGEVVGTIERVAAPGEWRTNVALGGTRRPARPNLRARTLALAAATAANADLVGVDLLPVGSDYVVLELNGAVDFTHDYAFDEQDVFARTVEALARVSLLRAA